MIRKLDLFLFSGEMGTTAIHYGPLERTNLNHNYLFLRDPSEYVFFLRTEAGPVSVSLCFVVSRTPGV
jgi:hypothetical protein